MINFEFMRECENCPNLEVTMSTYCITSFGSENEYHHTVTCEHKDKCQNIIAHLRKENEKNGN